MYISEVNGTGKVKSDVQVSINKTSDPVQNFFLRGRWGQCPNSKFSSIRHRARTRAQWITFFDYLLSNMANLSVRLSVCHVRVSHLLMRFLVIMLFPVFAICTVLSCIMSAFNIRIIKKTYSVYILQ